MNAEAKAKLAEQLLQNPLFDEVMNKLERDAIENCINAPLTDDHLRAAAAGEVRAVRNFRSACETMLYNIRQMKSVPA